MRGGAATEVIYGARQSPVTVVDICNGIHNVPRGVLGGHSSKPASNVVERVDGTEDALDNFFLVELQPGEWMRATDNGGGGYGPPVDRELSRVLDDVLEGYVSVEQARLAYGVVITGAVTDDDLAIDEPATQALRTQMGT